MRDNRESKMVSSVVKGSRDEKVGEYVWQDKMFSITLFATYIFTLSTLPIFVY
jgi:hypothetical protein